MSSSRLIPALVAGGVGVIGGIYIWNQPLQELTGKTPAPPPKDGRSQTAKDGNSGPSSAAPHHMINDAEPGNQKGITVAGVSSSARRSGSIDHDVKIRSNPNSHDGTDGGGVGVAEMRERKLKGQGLPSPQGGDTKAQPSPTKAQAPYSEHQLSDHSNVRS